MKNMENFEIEKRAMTEEEDKYSFRLNSQIAGQTGLIGWLRGDFSATGYGFYTSWNNWNESLKTEEFEANLDAVINYLREDGDILHDRKALARYCYGNPQSKMQGNDWYGVRADTNKYTFFLRLNPKAGDYNVYCYCYIKKWLNDHIKSARKGIRFVDSHYHTLFRIPDGSKIKIHYTWGEEAEFNCFYIDDYHVEVGSNLYHIAEFAERMEHNGHIYKPVVTEGKREYDVVITERSQMTVTVEASSADEAAAKAEAAWKNGDYIFDETNFKGVKFSVKNDK